MILRPYQQEAVHAIYHALRTRDDNPVAVLPTGSGKTPVLARICSDSVTLWGGRVIVLAHVKELLEQAADKLRLTCPGIPVGVYSAGLKSRETNRPVTVAGIQSVYKRACDIGPVDLIIVDEAHLIPPDGDGMYRTFLSEMKVVNPSVRVVGLTATPHRLKTGSIATSDGFLNHICYEVGIRELIVDGFLSPLISKAAVATPDVSRVTVRGGEYVASELENAFDNDMIVTMATEELLKYTADRQSVLVFTTGLMHAEHVRQEIANRGQTVATITGEDSDEHRRTTIESFKAGRLKYLVNVNVLTTGFDAPNVDAVALMRSTLSPGLYYQMVGRGFRLSPGKANCLVLDFGGNVLKHGPVDAIRVKERKTSGRQGEPVVKTCETCRAIVYASCVNCTECGAAFPIEEKPIHDAQAGTDGILSGQTADTEYDVFDVYYQPHVKKGATEDTPSTLRVEYRVGFNEWIKEWVCVEHTGWARGKAVQWWRARSREECPVTASQAAQLANAGAITVPTRITVRKVAGEPFPKIIKYDIDPATIPEPIGYEVERPEKKQATTDQPYDIAMTWLDEVDLVEIVKPANADDIPF